MEKNLSAEILNRLQFIVTVALFFTAVLGNFFNIYNRDGSDKTVLSFSLVILLYLVCYIFFDLLKSRIKLYWLKIINTATFFGLFSFLPLLMFFIAGKNPLMFGWQVLLFKVLIGLLILLPVLTLLFVVIGVSFKK